MHIVSFKRSHRSGAFRRVGGPPSTAIAATVAATLATAALALSLAACVSPETPPVNPDLMHGELSVTPPTAVLIPGAQVALTAKFVDAYVPLVRWRSSDAAVASVDSTGVVVAHAEGRATVSAVLQSDGAHRADAEIVVVNSTVFSVPVTIDSVTYAATGAPAKLDSLVGAVDVAFNIGAGSPPGTATLLVAPSVPGAPGGVGPDSAVATLTLPASGRVTLRWDTAARGATGAPAFPNGPWVVRGHFDFGGATDMSVRLMVTLRNP